MSDYPMLISNKLHSFRNFYQQKYEKLAEYGELNFFIFVKSKRLKMSFISGMH